MVRTLIAVYCLLFVGLANAQHTIECQTKLSNFHEKVKAKQYDDAYDDWWYVKTNCPDLSLAIYSDGEKILKHKIENTKGDERKSFIEDLIALWQARKQYFESRTPTGEFGAKICQLSYDYKDQLGKTNQELYTCFSEAFTADKTTFTHPKSLYTYFFVKPNQWVEPKYDAA